MQFFSITENGELKNSTEFKGVVAKFHAFTIQELALADYPLIRERLQAWTEIAHEQGESDFSATKLYGIAAASASVFFCQRALISNRDTLNNYNNGNSFHMDVSYNKHRPLAGDTGYGLVSVKRNFGTIATDESWLKKLGTSFDGDKDKDKIVAYGVNVLNDKTIATLRESGHLNALSESLTRLNEFCGHDFMHCATIHHPSNSDKKIPEVRKKIIEDERNTRDGIGGDENFLLLLNQKVFCKLREQDSPWFRALVAEVDHFTSLVADIEKATGDKEVTAVLGDIGKLHISNYVPKDELTNSPMSEWSKVVRTAQPQIKDDRLWYDGKLSSLGEISNKFYQAGKQDYGKFQEESRVAEHVLT